MKICLFILCFLFSLHTLAQTEYPFKDNQQQIELRHDNDFFVLTDRYYSSGLFLIFRKKMGKGLFTTNEQLDFRLGQEVYTPAQTQSTDSNLLDRPYTGFTGIWAKWSLADEKNMIGVSTLFGLAGSNSGAGGFQRWYHKAVAISDSPLWVDELNSSFHANLYMSYAKEWEIAPNPFGIRIALRPKMALGSRDIFGETETIIHFGRRNPMNTSIAYNRLGSKQREIYFALRFAYRQVFHNGLIEGNGFGDNSAVLRESENTLLRFGFDFNHRFDQNDYKIGIHNKTKETPDSKSHLYFQLSYGLSW